MIQFSKQWLTDSATLTAPVHTDGTLEGGMPDYETQAEDVPCRLIAESTGSFGGIMGRIPTGRYQVLFRTGVTIKEEWRVTVGGVSYEVVQVLSFGTHTEAILNKLNIAFTPPPIGD